MLRRAGCTWEAGFRELHEVVGHPKPLRVLRAMRRERGDRKRGGHQGCQSLEQGPGQAVANFLQTGPSNTCFEPIDTRKCCTWLW